MIVNLEFIRAIITAEEVLLLDPLQQKVLPFVDQLRQKLPQKVSQDKEMQSATAGEWLTAPETGDGLQEELPFEFQVLEIALEVVCTYLDSSVAELERDAYPALDELALSVSTKNLERVRSLKSNLTRLLARVQKVKILYLFGKKLHIYVHIRMYLVLVRHINLLDVVNQDDAAYANGSCCKYSVANSPKCHPLSISTRPLPKKVLLCAVF